MSSFLLINGPNLNLLGSREPDVYGATNLSDIEKRCVEVSKDLGHDLVCFQSNAEHELIDRVQQAAILVSGRLVMNSPCKPSTGTSVQAEEKLWI